MITDAVGEQILAAIIANPDDDGLRLVYADWCEDAGQAERAEFIRVQIELAAIDAYTQLTSEEVRAARRPGHAHSSRTLRHGCEYCEGLIRREARLLERRGSCREWLGPLQGLWMGGAKYEYRRGFIEEAGCTLQQWLDHGPALVRAHPLRRVVLTDCRQEHVDPEGGHYEGWVSLVGAANPPPGANLQELFAGPPFDHKLWLDLATALRLGSRYHPTRDVAVTFLSDACLEWARAEADRRDELRKRIALIDRLAVYPVV